ncbi:MAG: phosphatase PAP2 family protein [Candidatus Marinimicrobia bacterium]|nr:phosphatase PAP2 family protein [Candidatus Neomarinimicrobiota bacterium]
MTNIKSKYLQTPTDLIFYVYNLSIICFILFNIASIDHSFLLITAHLIIISIYLYLSALNSHTSNAIKLNIYIKIFFIISSLTFLHYESGLINLVIFPEYFDTGIRVLDIQIFGLPLYKIATKYLNNNFIVQTFHLFYMTYYFMLIIPVILIYKKQSKNNIYFTGRSEESLFLLLFTMFTCYWIFIIFPVTGPTDVHFEIFDGYGGIVKLVNYLYKYGDTNGGAMPSSHVAVSLVVTLFSFQHLKKWAPYILFCFIMLTLSTVYCSFHYALDAIAGILVGFGLYYLGKYVHRKLAHKIG